MSYRCTKCSYSSQEKPIKCPRCGNIVFRKTLYESQEEPNKKEEKR